MYGCPDVLIVYFDKGDIDDPESGYKKDNVPFPEFETGMYLGHKLWNKQHHAWSMDYVTCKDERWVSFGPFIDRDEMMRVLEDIQRKVKQCFLGYRIVNEHCVRHKKGLTHRGIWTHG